MAVRLNVLAYGVMFLVLARLGNATEYSPTKVAADNAIEDVRLLRRALQEIHPGYSRYTSREAMDQLFDALEKRVASGATKLEMYRDISYVLSKIRCGHTKAELPESVQQYRKEHATFLPISFRLISGRVYVDQTDGSQEGPQRGDEVISINGEPIGDVVEQVKKHLSVDGWTSHSKRIEIEGSSELMGNAVDHFWPMLYGWPDKWQISIRQLNGETVNHSLKPIKYAEWVKVANGGKGYNDFGPETIRFRLLDDRTAYLAVDTFVNYRNPMDAASLFQPLFERMQSENVEHLVIDLRQCGGGSDDVPHALLTFLADEPIEVARRPSLVRTYRFGSLRDHLTTWDKSVWNLPEEMFTELENGFFEFRGPDFQASTTITPASEHFTGRITLLTSAANSSGATNFIAFLSDKRARVTTVGEPTGGTAEGTTAGLIFFLKLPHCGTTVRIPALRNFNSVSRFEPGAGVQPDITVGPSLVDFLEGKDAVLEMAVSRSIDKP